ncbi:MAG: DUF5309 domain-containing protein [Bacteroides sp.]|nr:DUF5309 domain-containing protein [Bacteroides sp.]
MLTTQLTRELAPGLLRSEIDERIVKIRPSSTPLDQISRMVGARKASSMRIEYYSVDTKDGSTTAARSLRGLTLTHGTPFEIPVANGTIFSETETVLIPSLTIPDGLYKGQSLVAYISAIDGNTLTVIPVNIGESAAGIEVGTLSEGDQIIRMGRAARELDVQTTQYVALPKKDYNFCQIFKSQVEESLYQRLSDKEVGWTFSDQEEVAIMDMRMGMEKSFLFGARARVALPDGSDEILFTGGIWNQTDRTYNYVPGAFTNEDLTSLSRAAFTGRSGSSRKVLIAGSGLIENLSVLPNSRVITAEEKETVWGIDFHLIVTKFGTLYVHHSEVFDLCGKENSGMVIDPDYITKYSHVPFSAERISFRKQGVRNTEGVVLTEASCLVLRHPDSHLRIEPLA